MREHPPGDRRELAPLFDRQETLRAVVDAVLEGRLGRAWSSTGTPGAARLSLGCYEIFGGRPDPAAARELARGISAPRELVFGNDAAWRECLVAHFGARVSDRPMEAFVAAGPESRVGGEDDAPARDGFELVRMDAAWAARLDSDLAPHALQVFANPSDFAARGAGFAVVRGGQIASAATSYSVSSRALEVAISTRPAHRGRGLAFRACRGLLDFAARDGLSAQWHASNPISQRLARRLGLAPSGTCDVLLLA